MKSLGKNLLLIVVVAGVLTGLIIAYNIMHKEVLAELVADKPLTVPSRLEIVKGENVIVLNAAERTNAGILLAPLQPIQHRQQTTVYGMVVDPAELTNLRIAVVNARLQLVKANALVGVARPDYERLKRQYDGDGLAYVPQKIVETALAVLRSEEANAEAAQAALDSTLVQARQRWGSVVAEWLTQGGEKFERVERQDSLMVQVALSPWQGVGVAPSEASLQMSDGRLTTATLVSAAPRTDPKIQGPSFFYQVPAQGTGLVPGMNVVLLLSTGEPTEGSLLPSSAVVWLQGRAWAYLQVNPDRFARREVSTAQPTKEGWVLQKDFAGSATVVIRGAQVLLSEEFRTQITVGG